METASFDDVELEGSWYQDDETARWRTASGHAGPKSGSSLLEVDPGCRLPRHTDSAEEAVVVVTGRARVVVGDESSEVPAGGVALVPQEVPHEVHSTGDEPLRFIALYASDDVVTTYERDVQPDGERARRPF